MQPSPLVQHDQPPATYCWRPWYRPFTGCGLLIGLLALCMCLVGCGGTAQPGSTLPVPFGSPTVTQISLKISFPTTTPTSVPVPQTKATPTAMPTPRLTVNTVKPTPTARIIHPTPTATHCAGVNNNPWCYDFTPGNLIYTPASAFCSYFICVSTFWTANHGYVAECADTHFTHSGGVAGACSHNGGVLRPLYSH